MKGFSIACAIALTAWLAAPAAATERSPNGRIAFMRYVGDDTDIFSVARNGSALRRLTDTRAQESGPSYAPNGRRIAYSVGGETYNSDIWLMRADGKRRRRVVDLSGGNGWVGWAPGGRRFVFWHTTFRNRGDLYIAEPRSGRIHRLTRTRAEEATPVWSPDGDRIAFVSDRDGTQDVWTISSRGGDLKRVTTDAVVCESGCEDRYGGISGLDYSPNGDLLTFAANRGDGPSIIHVVSENGGPARRVTGGQHPAFSPNGRSVVFSSRGNLYRIRTDGSRRRRLTSHGCDYFPDWAPRLMR